MTVLDQKSWQEHDYLRYLGKEAPRYTSYPSAHHFEPLAAETYAAWLGALTREQSVGLYLHVPFCEQMCYFCGCNTHITRRYDPVEAYVACLIAEIGIVGERLGFRPKVHAVHFGGGSPGIMSPDDTKRVFEALRVAFDIEARAEVSIELDPRRVTIEKVRAYAEVGFNRVSLGVQDTQEKVQLAINRVQPMNVIERAVNLLRDHGLTSLGVDLIYGLPHQTVATLDATLNDVARLDPQRISAFSYAHVPWAKKHQRLIDAADLPDLAAKAAQYQHLDARLQAMGFDAIGIDHFARPEDGLARAARNGTLRRNFMGYTDLPNDRLIAFGASSISQLDGGIAQNIPQSTTYQGTVRDGRLPTVRGWAFQGDDRVRGAVISELMCRFAVDVAAVLKVHGYAEDYLDAAIADLAEFADRGIVTVAGRVVTFQAPLKMLVRSVACVFDHYARTGGENRYSKVA